MPRLLHVRVSVVPVTVVATTIVGVAPVLAKVFVCVISGRLPWLVVNVTVVVDPAVVQIDAPLIVTVTELIVLKASSAAFTVAALAELLIAVVYSFLNLRTIFPEQVVAQVHVIVCCSTTWPVVRGSSPVMQANLEQS
jgi:hypothetical protein